MKIDIKKIIEDNSEYIDKELWICDYRQEDLRKKPIRHVRPQKAILRSNYWLPKNKRVYYSCNHFVSVNSKGEPIKSKVIPIFDNTGFRSLSGTPLNVFDSEEECRMYYITQMREISCRIKDEINNFKSYWEVANNTLRTTIKEQQDLLNFKE